MPAATAEPEFRVVKPGDMKTIVESLRRGLPYSRLKTFERMSGLELDTICRVMHVPARTLARRKAAGKLKPDESERLLRLSILFQKSVQLCEGDVSGARQWLSTPKRGLGGCTPLELAESEIGAREVEDLIGRLENGVFP